MTYPFLEDGAPVVGRPDARVGPERLEERPEVAEVALVDGGGDVVEEEELAAEDAVLVGVLEGDAELAGGVEEDAHAAHRVVEDGQPHLADLLRLCEKWEGSLGLDVVEDEYLRTSPWLYRYIKVY